MPIPRFRKIAFLLLSLSLLSFATMADARCLEGLRKLVVNSAFPLETPRDPNLGSGRLKKFIPFPLNLVWLSVKGSWAAINFPVRVVSRQFGPPRRIGWLIKVPLFAPLGYGIYQATKDQVDEVLKISTLEDHADMLKFLIEWDFRFSDLKVLLANGEDASTILKAANNLYKELIAYDRLSTNYGIRLQKKDSVVEKELLAYTFYGMLKDLLLNHPQISTEQKWLLLTENHRRLVYSHLASLIATGQVVDTSSREIAEGVRFIDEDPFSQKLRDYERQGKLPKYKLIFYLQQDIDRRISANEDKILGKVQLRQDGSPVGLEEYRREVEEEIEEDWLHSQERLPQS